MKFIAKDWMQYASESEEEDGRYRLLIIHKKERVYAYMTLAYVWNFLDKDKNGERIETEFLLEKDFEKMLLETQATCRKFEGFER